MRSRMISIILYFIKSTSSELVLVLSTEPFSQIHAMASTDASVRKCRSCRTLLEYDVPQ